MNFKIRIMVRACKARLASGEELSTILASYPRLTKSEREEIRTAIEGVKQK